MRRDRASAPGRVVDAVEFTPFKLGLAAVAGQIRSFLSTLGYGTESLWDSRTTKGPVGWIDNPGSIGRVAVV